MKYKDLFWHRYLRRPYRLVRTIDAGTGQPVVFLHGIAASSEAWKQITEHVDPIRFRVLAFDLLGFGYSPNPDWPRYSVDDHARAVIASCKHARVRGPVILVGHSMGAVIATRVAVLAPKLVKHLILYQIPVYSDVPNKKIGDIRLRAYTAFFESIASNPKATLRTARMLERVASRVLRLTLTSDNWPAFERSLRNTILHEQVFKDIELAGLPTDVVYGSLDPLIIRKNMRKVFKNSKNVHFYRVDETHRISARAGKMIVRLINKA